MLDLPSKGRKSHGMGMLRGYEIKATGGLGLSISRKRAKNMLR